MGHNYGILIAGSCQERRWPINGTVMVAIKEGITITRTEWCPCRKVDKADPFKGLIGYRHRDCEGPKRINGRVDT